MESLHSYQSGIEKSLADPGENSLEGGMKFGNEPGVWGTSPEMTVPGNYFFLWSAGGGGICPQLRFPGSTGERSAHTGQ